MHKDLSELTTQSLLIVAHPDDEVLWFSSILDKVNSVVICFGDNESNPTLSEGRRRTIAKHPIQSLRWLQIEEAKVFAHADWESPLVSECGMQLNRVTKSEKRYKENYSKIRAQLNEIVGSYQNVITHNPWGEYGNEEHVQVFRIVEQLQKKHSFNLWVSNYCSDRTCTFMQMQIPATNIAYVSAETNKQLAHQLMQLYSANGCWTWYDDFEWFNEESFLKYDAVGVINHENKQEDDEKGWARNIPLNFIKMQLPRSKPATAKKSPPFVSRIFKKLYRVATSL